MGVVRTTPKLKTDIDMVRKMVKPELSCCIE